MDFGVANAPKFSLRFIPMDSPLDFTVQYQIWAFLALQNVGFCTVAISGFSPCWELVFGSKMMLGLSTMEWGWGRSNPQEVEWLVVQENRAHTLPYEFLGCPCSIKAMDCFLQPLPYNRVKCQQGKSNGLSQWHMAAYGSIPQPLHHSLVDTHGPFSFVASIVSFGILLLDVYLHHFYNVPRLNSTWVTSCPMLFHFK